MANRKYTRPKKKAETIKPEKTKQSETSPGEYSSMVVADLPLTSYRKIDKTSEGMYLITLVDGSSKELSLGNGEAELIDHYLNRHLKDDASVSDLSVLDDGSVEPPSVNRKALERNLGNWMDGVEFVDPDHVGYWATDDDTGYYLSVGYVYAHPNQCKFFDSTFADRKPGEGFSPSGRISMNGHTLLVAKRETEKALHDHHYRQRASHNDNQFQLTPDQLAQAGL